MAQERVLVIDNSLEAQQLLAEQVLEPNGYHPLTALDGEEGLQLAIQEHPALIILNHQLPGPEGLDVLEALRERDVEIPVIVTSTHESPELIVRSFQLGARDYVIKPFEPREMLKTIQRTLAATQSRDERGQLTQQLREANEQLERQLQELNALYAIGRAVTSLLDLNRVLNRIVEAAAYMAYAEEGMLLLLDEAGDELYLRATKDVGEKTARNLRVRVDDSAAGQAIRSDRPVLLTGDQAKVATGYLVNAMLYVPLRVPGRGVIGVLGVANREKEASFSEQDTFLLSALADYAAIAIENARLFDAVRTERVKLETVLREADEAIIVVDEKDNVLLCNATARAALDLPEADVSPQPVDEAVRHRNLSQMFAQARDTGQTAHREISLNDGRTFNAQLTPINGVGQVLMMQDITHLKELDRIKSEFVATVSHDLRTPLTSIQGYVELLSRAGPLNEQQRQFVRRAQQSMRTITELITDLLDIGQIEAGLDLDMSPCDLREIIEKAVDDLRPKAMEEQQELRWDPPDTLPVVQGNARRLRQVMDNLLSNAVKYTQENGWIRVSAAESKGHVVVRVADNGIGMPPDEQPYIFDRFYRVETGEAADIQGTGLGLAIVKAVIEEHNGRIWVESRPGVGSVFSFVLPALAD